MARKKINSSDLKTRATLIKKDKDYKKKYYNRPDLETNPDWKDTKEYMLPWAENIYSIFQKKRCWMGNDYQNIDLLRSYMEGNQPVDQYRDTVYGKSSENKQVQIDGQGWDSGTGSSSKSERVAYSNIDEKPVSIGPKIVTKILEQAKGMYYEMGVDAVDSMSTHLQEMQKAKMWFEKENQEWLQTQQAMMGIETQEPDFMPINVNELELYANSGGFKLPYAINMELLLKHTFDISYWSKEVFEKILKDLVSIRYALVREYYDPEDKRVKVKYVDPKYGGMQFSRDFSYRDSEYGYELEQWPISKVRQKFDLTYEEAAALAYANSGEFGNPNYSEWDNYGYMDDIGGSLGFDFYRVNVFRFEFIDIDNEKYYKHITKNGRVFNKPLKDKDPEGLEVYNNRVRYVREGTWIVGTKYMANYGKVRNMIRINPKKPRISYRGVRLGVPALFYQIKPFLNGLNIAWWKAQQAIAIAISNGIAVDVGALKNISIGKDKSWDVTKVLKYYRQEAILLYKKSNPLNFTTGGGGSPVQPMVTRMFENIVAQFDIMNKFMLSIEAISGISLVSTGDTPEPRIGKFNMEVALQGTNQVIGSVIRAATEVQADVGENCLYKIRSLCRVNKSIADSYSDVIGQAKMKVILMAEKSNVQYGLRLEARDITEMKAFIEEVLSASLKANSDGTGGLLDPSEVILVKDMMEQRQNFRMISITLGYMLRKKGKERELAELRKIELQGEQTTKAARLAENYKQDERYFELLKLQQKFENDYMIKYGTPPPDNLKQEAAANPPVNQQQPPVEQVQPEV